MEDSYQSLPGEMLRSQAWSRSQSMPSIVKSFSVGVVTLSKGKALLCTVISEMKLDTEVSPSIT